jgi:hypothetical protein
MACIGGIMFFKFISTFLGILFITGSAIPQEINPKFSNLVISQQVMCSTTKNVEEEQKNEETLFVGIMDEYHIFKITKGKEGYWTATIHAISGISCIHMAGTIVVSKSSKTKLRRQINGKYIYD